MHPVRVIDVELVITDSAIIRVFGGEICNDHLRIRAVLDLVLINERIAVLVSVITRNAGIGEGQVTPSQQITSLPIGTDIFISLEVDVGGEVDIFWISQDLDSHLCIGYKPVVFFTEFCLNLTHEVYVIRLNIA